MKKRTKQENTFLKKIGKRLKKLRGSITFTELHLRSGVSDVTIANIEAGKVNPTIVILKRIAGALDCEVDQLLWD